MDAFSYLSVLLSIILGLGLTQILTASGRLIRHRERIRFDWIPLVWASVLLLIYVQTWWAMFGLREVKEWTFLEFSIVLAQTIPLYLMAAVVLPEQIDEADVDLAEHYAAQQGWFFGLLMTTLVISVVKDLLINGQWPTPPNLIFHAVLATTCVIGMLVRQRRVQGILAIAGVAGITLYIGLLFARL